MRIVVVNNFFPPRVGGSSHLSDSLARGYARRGHQVLVLTAEYGDAPAEEVREGVRIVRFPAKTLPESRINVSFDLSFATRPGLARRLDTILDEFGPDVVHQHGQFMDLTWASGNYARRRGVPTLLSIHTRLENPAAHYRRIFRGLDALIVKPMMRRHRPRLVVMDTYMQDYITDRYRGAYRDTVAIPVGVDPVWIRAGDAATGRELIGVEADRPLIVSVGHVIPLRDRVGIVEALPAVLEKHPDAVLAVVGRVYYNHFLTRAEELGVSHAVRSLGAVPKASVPHLLAAADVECHEQGDGLGTATLESMAAGVPVVGWGRLDNFPGVELVEGRDIHLCPRGDVRGLGERLLRVLGDPAARATIGASASRVVDEHFALERVLDKHLDTLADLAAAGNRTSVR
ncbi:glycosyltransferase family 1 protein [Nocardioides gansuensis]|uniref:Glycosyltransferase family 1 protein n=1 Tax=Nocardioides gansuensis TaxID=2138300 RepID=A0A2T8F6N1_9ACTN|nr:glycosyltransferase family 4 protein [Nocardioides gansuensis]PVG81365.1 glycosyltransferase family 1 protein [Nocardioides gansuensis]